MPPSKNPGGRPAYVPTEADRNTVKNLAAAGIPQRVICTCLSKPLDEKTLRKHFGTEIAISEPMVTAVAMSKLYSAIMAGEAWAICFWLKCKGGFQETHRQVLMGDSSRPLEVQVVYADKSIPE
jgi:hypothetical protein